MKIKRVAKIVEEHVSNKSDALHSIIIIYYNLFIMSFICVTLICSGSFNVLKSIYFEKSE